MRRIRIRNFRQMADTGLIEMVSQRFQKLFSSQSLDLWRVAPHPNPSFDERTD